MIFSQILWKEKPDLNWFIACRNVCMSGWKSSKYAVSYVTGLWFLLLSKPLPNSSTPPRLIIANYYVAR